MTGLQLFDALPAHIEAALTESIRVWLTARTVYTFDSNVRPLRRHA